MDTIYLLTFENTYEAMRTEAKLNINGIKYYVMPTPTEIVKSCGISISIQDYQGVIKVIMQESLNIKSMYKRKDSIYIKVGE